MIILHGAFDGGFFIWGECSFSKAGLHNLRRMRRVGGDCVVDHTWDPGAEKIAEILEGFGFHYDRSIDSPKAVVELPTFAQKYPVPSSSLLGEIPTKRIARNRSTEYELRKWYVDQLPLSVQDLTRLISTCACDTPLNADGRLLAPGVMMALDLCYIAECHRMAVSLVERGRFLPDLKKTGESKYESIWRPLMVGEDAERFAHLMRAMPPIVRSLRTPKPATGELLYELLGTLVDSMVRYAWTRKIKKGADSDADFSHRRLARSIIVNGLKPSPASTPPERRKRGRLVSSLNPHSLWIRSLGWSSEAEEWSPAFESIYQSVREWWGKFEWFARSPYKVCIRLVERNGQWRLEYSMLHMESDTTIPSVDVWSGKGPYVGGASGSYLRRYLMLSLGQIGRLISSVRESLELLAPSGCSLTIKEAEEFLCTQAPMLSNRGICIRFPEWWKDRACRKLTLRGRASENDRNGVAGENEEVVLSFAWELMLDGTSLSDDEAKLILEDGVNLFKLRGEWTFVHPDDVEAARERLARMPSRMTPSEALRFAVRDEYVDGFTGVRELEAVHASLVKGIPREILQTPPDLQGELRQYQRRGYSWLSLLSRLGLGACLADDMGLGKTLQTLALIQHHRDRGELRPVLLICPTSVLENWRIEMRRFLPKMTSYLHHGRKRSQGEDFLREIEGKAMVLSSYAILQREASLYQKVDWAGVVLDEAQNIKNPDTLQARAARGIKSDWRIVLTGTPVENHVGDLWSIMEFLMPGLLGNRRYFTNEYVRPIQENHDTALMESLKHRVGPFIMRRMKTDKDIVPDLPQKIETKVFCGLKKEQVQLYSDVSAELNRSIAGATGIQRKGMVLAGLTRIKQICDHPSLVTKDENFDPERSSKMERLFALAEEMFETGDRTLIFTQYVEMGNILKAQLQERFGKEALFLHGGVFKDVRDKMVRRFQESVGAQFFILSLKAGGVGLNLTNANRVVLYDRWWNPAVEQQAIDRAYRIGQTRNVQVHVFCCKGTLEERIDELVASKREVASRVIENNDTWVTELSDRELRELLSLSPGALEV